VEEAHLRKSTVSAVGCTSIADSSASPGENVVSARIDHLSIFGIALLTAECIAWAGGLANNS
jgi:hypothetical protein